MDPEHRAQVASPTGAELTELTGTLSLGLQIAESRSYLYNLPPSTYCSIFGAVGLLTTTKLKFTKTLISRQEGQIYQLILAAKSPLPPAAWRAWRPCAASPPLFLDFLQNSCFCGLPYIQPTNNIDCFPRNNRYNQL